MVLRNLTGKSTEVETADKKEFRNAITPLLDFLTRRRARPRKDGAEALQARFSYASTQMATLMGPTSRLLRPLLVLTSWNCSKNEKLKCLCAAIDAGNKKLRSVYCEKGISNFRSNSCITPVLNFEYTLSIVRAKRIKYWKELSEKLLLH